MNRPLAEVWLRSSLVETLKKEQSSYMEKPELIVAGMNLGLCVTSGVTWVILGLRFARGMPLIAARQRELVPWGLRETMLATLCILGIPLVGMLVFAAQFNLKEDTKLSKMDGNIALLLLRSGMKYSIASTALAVAVVAWLSKAKRSDFGLTFQQAGADLKLGLVSFIAIGAPVLLLQAAVQAVFKLWQPEIETHPLVELIQKSGDERFWWQAIFSAVLVAPLAEEIQFRALLQGLLEKAAALLLVQQKAMSGDGDDAVAREAIDAATTHWWPVVVSSSVFALMHIGHGPDPIPLFVFALGLGYVYRQTHSLIPCIVIHFLLNAWSMMSSSLLMK